MDNFDDQQYICRVRQGDTKAFAALVNQYKDLVFTLSLKMLKDREEAEEVAQDTFVKIHQALNKFNGTSKFSTWIYKVTFNTCLDRLKKNKRSQRAAQPVHAIEGESLPSLNILDSIEERDRKKMIRDCLDRLPGEDSFLLTLYYFDEMSMEEIATIIGINANNVKIRLFRSRKKFAALLKDRSAPQIL